MRKLDLTGKRFGMLTVLDEAEPYVSPRGHCKAMWNRKRDCGNMCVAMGSHLTTGHSMSCGCQRTAKLKPRQSGDLTGRKFGTLIVVRRMPNRIVGKNSRVVWHCLCGCGNETDVLALLFKEGLVKSCGCLNVSHAERIMSMYLSVRGIAFETEYVSDGLYGVNGGALKFDFALPGETVPRALIELDGEQHYRPVEYFGGERKYEAVRANDVLKDRWAADHGVPLVRIDVSKRYSDSDFIAAYDDAFDVHSDILG